MKSTLATAALLAQFALLTSPARGGDWPQLRGPHFNGSSDETGLPSGWSRTEGIAWAADLPGPSAATPAVWGDRVFVSSADPATDTLKALCIDRKNGALLWQHDVAKGIRRDSGSTYATPSPATDGDGVIFFYGNGVMIAYEVAGKERWRRDITEDFGEFAFFWTFSSSPLLHRGTLFLQVLQRDVAVEGRGLADRENESYLLAMDPKTGATRWRHVRRGAARLESKEAYTTPLPLPRGDGWEVVIAGADVLTGHDPATGKELWRWGTWNPRHMEHWPLVPSPVAAGDIVIVCASKRDPIYAVRARGAGDLGEDALVWASRDEKDVTFDVPTPALYDGDLFVLSDVRKRLLRVEPGTGRVRWTLQTPGLAKYEASPLAADGKVYLMNVDGEVAVVDAGEGRLLGVIPMETTKEEPVRSAIIAARGQLYVRTNRKLFCISGQSP